MMKTLFLLSVMITGALYSVQGQTFIIIHQKDGHVFNIPVDSIQKITFEIDSAEAVTGSQKSRSQTVKTLKLLQNFPNPFNPSTTIEYQLPRGGEVTIAIYDIRGREVRKLTFHKQKAGKYRLTWDGRNNHGHPVASGMYFYQIRFEGNILTRKMLLIR
ncbi:MAG: T9SS type A sorting domain-containing protein [Calditrichaeota bacterium]|nr:T9SS type A sorting domain-containing protein [Calditrichota bacterium]